LPAWGWIVIDKSNALSALCGVSGGGKACRTRANYEHVELVRLAIHVVTTSIPGSQGIRQLRQCGLPLMITRHSKQIPIPHKTLRASPLTEVRQKLPANITATATLVPRETDSGNPFTVSET
jgi:hypothetical protein